MAAICFSFNMSTPMQISVTFSIRILIWNAIVAGSIMWLLYYNNNLLNSIFEHWSVISLRVVFKKFSQHQPVLFKVNTIFNIEFFISVWPGILILHDRSWSILVQVMACRLKAPHHLLVSILINITCKNYQEYPGTREDNFLILCIQ